MRRQLEWLRYTDFYYLTLHGGVTGKEYAGNLRINRNNSSKGLKPIQAGHLVVRDNNRYLGTMLLNRLNAGIAVLFKINIVGLPSECPPYGPSHPLLVVDKQKTCHYSPSFFCVGNRPVGNREKHGQVMIRIPRHIHQEGCQNFS
jgi:hypothetical protein